MPSATATEFALYAFNASKHRGRLQVTFHKRDGIGEVAAGTADRGVEHDGRGIEQAEFLIEPRDRCFDNLRRPTIAPMRPVRPDRDGIEVLSQTTTVRPEPVEGLPFITLR